MERHSVPQNIMDVEFKLFGSLTVKQFGNLAAGIIIAVIIYFINPPFIIKWPLIFLSAFLGLAFALFQVNGQPFGRWFGNFILAMMTSQRKVWKRKPKIPEILSKTYKPDMSKDSLVTTRKKVLPPFLKEDISVAVNNVDTEEKSRLERLDSYLTQDPTSITSFSQTQNLQNGQNSPVIDPATQNIANQTGVGEGVDVITESSNYAVTSRKIQNRKQRALGREKIHKNLADEITLTPDSKKDIPERQKYSREEIEESNKILRERIEELSKKPKENKSEIEKKLEELQQSIDMMNQTSNLGTSKITSTRPNVISGLIADKSGNPIGETRVLIKDRKGYLIRSLLSDPKGEFNTSTDLPEGEYFVEFESETHDFDTFRVKLDGKTHKIYKFTAN